MPVLGSNPYNEALQRINLLGPDLTAARSRMKLSAQKQADAIGISLTSLSGITSGKGNPSKATTTACLRWLSSNINR